MKVLIVDDEPIVRKVLKTMIRWEEYGLQWGGEACDGLEAWELLQQESMDLVVTDILMPRLDGLELVKRLRQAKTDAAVVVLSCLDDFSYVKEAMKQGAHDYILKPTMEPEQLADILVEAKEALLKQRMEKEQREQLHRQLQLSNQAQWGMRLQKCWISGYRDEDLEQDWFQEGRILSSCMIQFTMDSHLSLLGWQWPGAFAYVSLSEQRTLLVYEDIGTSRSVEVEQTLTVQFGLGQESFCLTEVRGIHRADQLYNLVQEHELVRHRLFYDRKASDLAYYGSIDTKDLKERNGILPLEERQNLLKAISGQNEEAMNYWAKQVTVQLEQNQPSVDITYNFIYELLGLAAAFARQQVDVELEHYERQFVSSAAVQAHLSIASLAEWFLEAVSELAGIFQSNAQLTSRNPFVRKAMSFMRQQYHLQISTSDIADHVKLSRSYLSDLYSKETGESLIETLTSIRIQEAKRLLRHREQKVYEVAEAVGFVDPKTFTKTFKKIVGCSPKEYEEQNK
ncbi:response regulator [Paenibacillus sp. UNC451MF]|uniref:response regulator n=1 Tax=Paenibacillus sp. UNC451MF TaxID=1449063 RepID=UPI0004913DA7|nr:response regulator [Paenibacillus sp. UNC451MF]